MNIKLLSTKVKYLEFSDYDGDEDFTISFGNGYSDDDLKSFIVKFDISVKSGHGYKFDLEYIAEFGTDDEISDDFISSHFPVVNAPAIAYPFMRSFVSTVTLNAGYEPVILPTINFQAMLKQRESEEISHRSE
jgi:preprotein translocase subunit SecB